MGTGLPQKVMVKHKYVQSNAIVVPAGTINFLAFRANGMTAPCVPVVPGTHQPMYFDQYSALYEHYCVIAAKITFKVVHVTSPTADSAYKMCAYIDSDATFTGTNIDAVAEATQGRSITQVPPGQSNQAVKTLKFSAKRIFGGSVLGNKALTGTAGANPTELSYFVLCIEADPGQNTDLAVTAEIEYVAIWTELKEVAQS